tara:strand:+ start:60715 stop:60990 length:276 start_codon:yes stop_codon:yes gene_type:complete
MLAGKKLFVFILNNHRICSGSDNRQLAHHEKVGIKWPYPKNQYPLPSNIPKIANMGYIAALKQPIAYRIFKLINRASIGNQFWCGLKRNAK